MTPSLFRKWIPASLWLHVLLIALLARISVTAPQSDAVTIIPIRIVSASEPAPPASRALPKPLAAVTASEPQMRAGARPAARAGQPRGRVDGVSIAPAAGSRRDPGKTPPAPPAVMRARGGSGFPAPPGIPGGTGTRGTGIEPAGSTNGPVRLGGDLPAYPKLAEDEGQEGTVVVSVAVSPTGEVESASVSVSSGHPSLDAAALRAARSWRFKPALKDGKPVSGGDTLRFHFADGSVTGG